MIAKIIVHGPTRAVALSQLTRALAHTQVAGTVTNLAFLGALARHAGFAKGDVDTGLIERNLAELTQTPAASDAVMALAVLTAANLPSDPLAGFTQWAPLHHSIGLTHQAEDLTAKIEPLGPNHARVALNGAVLVAHRRGGAWLVDGAPAMPVVQTPAAIYVFAGDATFTFTPVDPLARNALGAGAGNATLSPMPGLVKAVFVTAGQTVQAGDRLAVLEAMKMEHTLTAARDGVVAEVLAAAGDQVEAGAALILLEDDT